MGRSQREKAEARDLRHRKKRVFGGLLTDGFDRWMPAFPGDPDREQRWRAALKNVSGDTNPTVLAWYRAFLRWSGGIEPVPELFRAVRAPNPLPWQDADPTLGLTVAQLEIYLRNSVAVLQQAAAKLPDAADFTRELQAKLLAEMPEEGLLLIVEEFAPENIGELMAPPEISEPRELDN